MDDFQTWVNSEISIRGWSFNALAERMGLTSSAVSKVMLGQNRLTFDFCLKLSKAFELAPEKVFRLAGLLPSNNEEETIQELIDIARVLNEEEVHLVLGFAQWRYNESRDK